MGLIDNLREKEIEKNSPDTARKVLNKSREIVYTGGEKMFVYDNKTTPKIDRMSYNKLTVEVKILKSSGKPASNIEIKFNRIDCDFFDSVNSKYGRRSLKPKRFIGITDENGKLSLSILEGKYLVTIDKNNSSIEKIYDLNKMNRKIKMTLPIFFTLFGTKEYVDKEDLLKLFKEIRDDKKCCSFCKEMHAPYGYLCHYCGKYYCFEHLPKIKHKCKGGNVKKFR